MHNPIGVFGRKVTSFEPELFFNMPNLKTLILPRGSNSHYGYSLFVGSDNIENLAILNGEGYNFFEPLNALYSPNIKECLLSYTNKFLNSTLEEGNHIIYKTK